MGRTVKGRQDNMAILCLKKKNEKEALILTRMVLALH